MEFLIYLFVMLAVGGICATSASNRGRSAVGWFFIGFFFGCLPIIILLVLPNPQHEERRFKSLAKENRRLSEVVKKNRLVADDHDGTTRRRLGAHDRALGLDTSAIGQPEDLSLLDPPPIPPSAGSASVEAEWYYANGSVKVGPLLIDEMRHDFLEGEFGPESLVWCKGMDDWGPASDFPDIIAGSEGDQDA